MFDRDSLWFGILTGIVMPLLLYGLLFLLWLLFSDLFAHPEDVNLALLQIISPVINLFFIRYYFVTKKYDDTGRGILLVTFIYVIAFFVINRVPGVGLTLFGG